jgi:hypothetical protein
MTSRSRWARSAFAAALLAAACAGVSIDQRYEAFEGRMADLTQQAEQGQARAAALGDTAQRETRLAQWQSVLQMLAMARTTGALAYLNENADSLARIEEQVAAVVESCAEQAATERPATRR